MTRLRRTLGALLRDERGATIIEFAMVLLPLCLILLGTLDLGYTSYLTSIVQGTLQEAAREAALGNKRDDEIDEFVKQRLSALVHRDYVAIQKKSYADFTGINGPEKITYDKNGNGSYEKLDADCFQDFNENGRFDLAAAAGTSSIGKAEQVMFYEVTIQMPRITPVGGLMEMATRGKTTWSNTNEVRANTVIRNQPYASEPPPRVLCGV